MPKRSSLLAWSLLGTALAGCAAAAGDAGPAAPQSPSPSEEFSLDARVWPGRGIGGGVWEAELHIPPEDDATVRFTYLNPHLPASDFGVKEPFRLGSLPDGEEEAIRKRMEEQTLRVAHPIALEDGDRRRIREVIERSGFFGDWPPGEEITCQSSWTVSARRGGVGKSRDIYAQPEFKASEALLWRVIRQGVGEWAVASGRQDILSSLLEDSGPEGLLHAERLAQAFRHPPPVGTACPNPDCGCQGPPKPRAKEAASAEEKERARVAEIRAPGAVTIEAKGDRPVRGVLVSNGRTTLVEVCVKEVAATGKERLALARFAMRLCDERGTTHGEELRSSRTPGRHFDAIPDGWSSDEASGRPFFRYFACPGGTAWEIDGILDVLDGGGVRFTLRPVFQICTK